MKFLFKLSDDVSKYMAPLVIVVTAVSLLAPWTFRWTTPHVTIFLGVAMLGMGMTLKLDDFRAIIHRPRGVLIGAAAQFTVMPMLALWLAGEWIAVSLAAMMLSIVQVVILPIGLGLAINAAFGGFVRRIEKLLPLLSIFAILLILGGVVSINAEKILSTGLIILFAVACHNLLSDSFQSGDGDPGRNIFGVAQHFGGDRGELFIAEEIVIVDEKNNPVLGREGRARSEGHKFCGAEGRGRSDRAGETLRSRAGGRVGISRHNGVSRTARDDRRGGARLCVASFHTVHGGRRDQDGR